MAAQSTRLDLQKANVLLVDDSPQSLELLSHILTGFRVRSLKPCRSAKEARELLPRQSFDLLLIDADMPVEDGISLTQEVRREAKHPNQTAPIVLVSGFTPKHRVLLARDAGANLVVRKPIAPATLLGRIEWLAKDTRDFICTPTYCGPDRRFKYGPLPEGIEERRSEAIAIAATPEREMSQEEVDALFN